MPSQKYLAVFNLQHTGVIVPKLELKCYRDNNLAKFIKDITGKLRDFISMVINYYCFYIVCFGEDNYAYNVSMLIIMYFNLQCCMRDLLTFFCQTVLIDHTMYFVLDDNLINYLGIFFLDLKTSETFILIVIFLIKFKST